MRIISKPIANTVAYLVFNENGEEVAAGWSAQDAWEQIDFEEIPWAIGNKGDRLHFTNENITEAQKRGWTCIVHNLIPETELEKPILITCPQCGSDLDIEYDDSEETIVISHEGYMQCPSALAIWGEIAAERKSQDIQWGGPIHDDTHTMGDWVVYICQHAGRSIDTTFYKTGSPSKFRKEMVKVAALAVAAIEQCDRLIKLEEKKWK